MKMKLFFVLGLVTIFSFTQCKSDKKTKEKQATENDIQGSEDDDKIVYMLPSPDEIFSEIFMVDIQLKSGFVNPASNASNYVDLKSQSINLGVYISDFAYLSAMDNNTDELAYLKVIRELTDKVNLYGVITEDIIDRINENLMVRDSLSKISQELYYNMSEILENTDRNNILVLISTGAIVEALYLAINNIDFDHSSDALKKIFEQKFVFDNYYEFASQYSDDIYVKTVLKELTAIKDMFDHFDYTKSDVKITKEQDNMIIIEGGKEIIVTKESYLGFRENITNVRTLLISISKSIN